MYLTVVIHLKFQVNNITIVILVMCCFEENFHLECLYAVLIIIIVSNNIKKLRIPIFYSGKTFGLKYLVKSTFYINRKYNFRSELKIFIEL